MTRCCRVNPWVTHDRLDNEVIAINLETGAYFALAGVGADCWTLLVAGVDTDAVTSTIAERYSTEPQWVARDVEELIGELVSAGLVTTAGTETPGTSAPPLPERASAPDYAAPILERYDDLEQLLLLDPIHEVDEAGWPVAAAE